MLGAKGPRVAQAQAILDAHRARLGDGQGIEGGLERIVEGFADLGLGEVAQDDGIFEVHSGLGIFNHGWTRINADSGIGGFRI